MRDGCKAAHDPGRERWPPNRSVSDSNTQPSCDQHGDSTPSVLTFEEPRRYRYMRFGFPAGLLFLASAAAGLAQGLSPMLGLFYLAFVLLIAQATAVAMLTAYRVRVTDEGLTGEVPFRQIAVPWTGIRSLEMVDRRDLAFPRRLVRIVGPTTSLFAFDSTERFDEMLGQMSRRAGIRVSAMPLWERLLLLQWGV